MKIAKLADSKVGMVLAIGAMATVAVYVVQKKAIETAGDVGHAISPTNNDNIFAAGVDSVGAKLSGDENFKLGVWLYDVVN
jgi:hypothetical protein